MLYPRNLEIKLGFDRIRELIKKECLSTLGSYYVDKMKFSNSYARIRSWQTQTEELATILSNSEDFPSSNYIDVSQSLEKIRIVGVYLLESEFHALQLSLDTIFKCLSFLNNAEGYPELKKLVEQVDLDKIVVKEISQKIDEDGKLRNNATPELSRIRKTMLQEQAKLRKVLDQMLRKAIEKGYTSNDHQITIRNGRMVIPVLAEHKRRIKGFIHDESSTGQLVYLEPAEVLEINNELRELESQEKREVIRILTELTDFIRPFLPSLKKAYNFLSLIDFIRAKARFALKTESVKPEIKDEQVILWSNARHPLLQLTLQEQDKKVVPLNISLNDEQRILLISGPNAGGKSVCLKTVGLLQYMFQTGLMVPVKEDSTFGLFDDLFIDIGDEQSLENDLSTYSSHLKNMNHFVNRSNEQTLFLIDEFGTGTEPNFGGAIAESILETLNNRKAFGVITTHYSNLKAFADKTPFISNAAMRFDVENLEPLYQLEIGKPGSSFALEIARKIGLPRIVVNKAKQNLGEDKVNFDKLLNKLEQDKKFYEEQNTRLKSKNRELEVALKKYEQLTKQLENDKKEIINKAKEEAKQLLSDTNQKIEATIKSIKENKAEKTKTKALRENLEQFRKSIKKEKVEKKEIVEVVEGKIELGCYVRIKGQDTIGEVMSIKGKDVEILIGELKSNIKLNRLEKVSKRQISHKLKEIEKKPLTKGIDLNKKRFDFSTNLDVRGKRVEEALPEVEAIIDDALMFGINEIKIIHGKGDGILREVIRDYLRNYSHVKKVRDEHVERGGAGVSIVELK
ncbi:endonuclease MutS2 [Fulvivirgaceae bacterium BMA10]|uniref:Endonuclease MutS2 n=1 Tax=Splendidivirga corallicola TaxID=3051826 RepID=A0ABT8KQZ5_9BACT|nr:endonuclease MutS2 [Fulvivirgaceae bacterium BMA10]